MDQNRIFGTALSSYIHGSSAAIASILESARATRQLLEQLEFVEPTHGDALRVGVFGVTGVGKSSLCNALAGQDLAAVSAVAACTRKTQDIPVVSYPFGGKLRAFTLVDVPGLGETPARDAEYLELYKQLIPQLDLVVWAIKADDRAYTIGMNAYRTLLKSSRCPVLFVLTQVEKVEPVRHWNSLGSTPGIRQMENIEKKRSEVASAFNVAEERIVSVSVTESYQVEQLRYHILSMLYEPVQASR
ncbi:50S ribosome-binding GTPase [Pseudomonas sp. 14P_8.1_Bac3]|uniref:GTPase family protein n=1 Tax=Pseudomonas sp. 14P_8.1_Bac3 TaxID=2971621 RepID=UPI0021C7D615|nr:GTPase [Pseudomonas sp. 14P_8.1_Bac3]MCU1759303.1 50S ribosome-binding GTPase [Pseudomonas sp. 14P_8.1_Bac3]